MPAVRRVNAPAVAASRDHAADPDCGAGLVLTDDPVAGSSARADVNGGLEPIRPRAAVRCGRNRLAATICGVLQAYPARGCATPAVLHLVEVEARALWIGAHDTVACPSARAHVKCRSSGRVNAHAVGAGSWLPCLALLNGTARLASLHVGRNLGFELRERTSVAREVAQRIGMVGAAKADSSVVVADKTINSPTSLIEVVTAPFNGFVPLFVEIGAVCCVAKLDVDATAVPVANSPCLAIILHAVVHGGSVQVHHVLDGVGIAAAVKAVMVVCASAWVVGFVHGQILGAVVAVPLVANRLFLLVGMRRAREHQRSAEDQRQHERRKLGERLHLVLIHGYRRPSPR